MSKAHQMQVPFEVLGSDVLADVTYTFTKGSPAVMYQRNGDPGWPADPDEIEVTKVTIGNAEVPDWLFAIMQQADIVYEWICEHHNEPEPDWDHERDRRRDDALTDRANGWD